MDPRTKYPELQGLKWNVSHGEVQWSQISEASWIAATGTAPNEMPSGAPMGAQVCVRCKGVWPLLGCGNCKGFVFKPGFDSAGAAGLFCTSCDRGFTDWTCEHCGTINAIRKSLGVREQSSMPALIGCLVVLGVVVGGCLLYAQWLG